MKADEQINDRCRACGKIIDDEEYITIFEPKGLGISEEMLIGYNCKCGHKERY